MHQHSPSCQTRKRTISPPGELAQASYMSLKRDSTNEVELDVVLLTQASSFSLEQEYT